MAGSLEKQLAALKSLSELEESVGRLYEIYAEVFPEYSQFWSELVSEEMQHANWLRQVQSKAIQGNVKFSETRFNANAIQTFLNYLRDEAEKARLKQRSLLNAFSIALQLEESLMERKYFSVVDGDSIELRQVLTDLAAGTQAHITRVRHALEKYKRIKR
jgi:hypothetical protein